MEFVPDHQLTFSNGQLKRWGIIKIAKKEALIDHFIEEVEKPNEEIKKYIIENWLRKEGIKSNESLKNFPGLSKICCTFPASGGRLTWQLNTFI